MTNEVATLIGDLIGSRASADRPALHAVLGDVLARVNDALDPVTPLRITVGDEYQGAFADVATAARAALLLRVGLLPSYDVRHGIGWGPVTLLEDEPRVEDGPGWWVARDALEEVERLQERSATRHRRCLYRASDGGGEGAGEAAAGPSPVWVSAALLLVDEVVSGLSDRSVSVLRGLLEGHSQKEMARELGISPSAVSQRVRADGLAAIVAVDELWKEGR